MDDQIQKNVDGEILRTTEPTEDQTPTTTVDFGSESTVDQAEDVTVDSFDIQTALTVNQISIEEVEVFDHRLFYSSERYRIADGTHDGKLVTTYELDMRKVAEYYYEHFYPETWYISLDSWPPGFILPFRSTEAGQY